MCLEGAGPLLSRRNSPKFDRSSVLRTLLYPALHLRATLNTCAMQVHPKCKTLGAKGDPADGRICLMRADEWKDMIKTTALPLLTAVEATRRDILVRFT